MSKVKAFCGLIRWANLLYIVLTQLLIFFCLNEIKEHKYSGVLDILLLLIISSVCLAAAGYIINDYFDVKADEINKPNKIYVNRVFKRRTLMIWHILLNLIGISLGFYIAHLVGNLYLGFIHIIIWFLLWYYSVSLKRKPFIGNLVVSVITALVVLVVYWFLPFVPFQTNFLLGYALFAFLVNLQREIVKDLEDIEGDKLIDCKTLPIIWGIKKTKHIAITVNLITFCFLLFFMFYQKEYIFLRLSVLFTITFIQIPLLYIITRLKKADTSQHFKKISNYLKLIMLAGILLLVVLKVEGTV